MRQPDDLVTVRALRGALRPQGDVESAARDLAALAQGNPWPIERALLRFGSDHAATPNAVEERARAALARALELTGRRAG